MISKEGLWASKLCVWSDGLIYGLALFFKSVVKFLTANLFTTMKC